MAESDLLYLEEKFTTFVLGQEFELVPYGKYKHLTLENRAEYCFRSRYIQLAALKKPLSMMRKGLIENLFSFTFNCYTPSGLDMLTCGMNYVLKVDNRLI